MTSCNKIEGCTDINSPSYNADAEKDDGTCESVADALVGTWNVTETALGIPLTYEADITKVDDNTITITQKNRIAPPNYAPASIEVDTDWVGKRISSTNDVYTGTIDTENKLNLAYEVQSTVGQSFTVSLEYTR